MAERMSLKVVMAVFPLNTIFLRHSVVIYEGLAWIKLFFVLVLSEDDIYQVIKQFLSWLVDLTIELHC